MGLKSAASAARVLVFDSGVGGLSVVRELRRQLPDLTLDYLVDNAFSPYGNKDCQTLKARIPELLKTAMKKTGADLLVVACNTASTAALSELRAVLDQPVVGTVPAIKPAAESTRSGVIGLLATPATLESEATHALIREHASHCRVITYGSMALVRLAEAKLRGHFLPKTVVRQAIAPLFHEEGARDMDHIVLGCTHFPLLREDMENFDEFPVTWLDSGEAIAMRVKALLGPRANSSSKPENQQAFFTTWTPGLGALRPAFSELGFREMTWLAQPESEHVVAA